MNNIKQIIQKSLTTEVLIKNLIQHKHIENASKLLNEIESIRNKEIYIMTVLFSENNDYHIYTNSFIDDHVIEMLENGYSLTQFNPKV